MVFKAVGMPCFDLTVDGRWACVQHGHTQGTGVVEESLYDGSFKVRTPADKSHWWYVVFFNVAMLCAKLNWFVLTLILSTWSRYTHDSSTWYRLRRYQPSKARIPLGFRNNRCENRQGLGIY